MKKVTDALNLPEGSDEDAMVAAIDKLRVSNPPTEETPSAKVEKRIRAKMRESNGALNYEQAKLAVEGQDASDAAQKPKTIAKPKANK
jgi:hypothetical protein